MSAKLALYFLTIVALAGGLKLLSALQTPIEPNPVEPSAFLASALKAANDSRSRAKMPPLQASAELQQCLRDFAMKGRVQHGLNGVFPVVEAALPQIQELSVNLVTERSQEDVIAALAKWPDLTYPQHTHYGAWVFQDPNTRQVSCLAVTARELPPLHLPFDPVHQDAFFEQCHWCDKGYRISFAEQNQNTLIVTCPHCKKAYDLIATDSSGQWRRATQFFKQLKAETTKPEMSPKEQVMAIWKEVAAKCRYQLDAQRINGADSWCTPDETYAAGSGDCEDTSLLLVDLLTSQGFDAKVALGTHEGEGHAWVVVNIEGVDHLLESTWRKVDHLKEPPTVDAAGLAYDPDYLFDRSALYFSKFEGWTGDYRSEKTWTRVDYAPDELAGN